MCLLRSPLLFPPVAQESDRRKWAGARSHSCSFSPRWIFRGPQIPPARAIGCFPASPRPRQLTGISSVERLGPAFFCRMDQEIGLLGRMGWIPRIPQELYTGFVLGFFDSESSLLFCAATVLIASGISMLNLVCSHVL